MNNKYIQFARLLAEIRAEGLTEDQYDHIGASMDCDRNFIDEVLEQAEDTFEELKPDPNGYPKEFDMGEMPQATEYAYLKVKPTDASQQGSITVEVKREGEGVVVDLWATHEIDQEDAETIGSTYAFWADAMPEEG